MAQKNDQTHTEAAHSMRSAQIVRGPGRILGAPDVRTCRQPSGHLSGLRRAVGHATAERFDGGRVLRRGSELTGRLGRKLMTSIGKNKNIQKPWTFHYFFYPNSHGGMMWDVAKTERMSQLAGRHQRFQWFAHFTGEIGPHFLVPGKMWTAWLQKILKGEI